MKYPFLNILILLVKPAISFNLRCSQVFCSICLMFAASTWEQRKLGQLANIVRGASPRPISNPKWSSDESSIGWLRISDVTEQNGRIHCLEQHISKLGQEKTRVLYEQHLLLSIAATVGKPVMNYVPTGVHDGFLIFLKPKFNMEYMFQWLAYIRSSWGRYGQPGSQVNLNSELVRNKELAIPDTKEQKIISITLKKFDDLIAANEYNHKNALNIRARFYPCIFT